MAVALQRPAGPQGGLYGLGNLFQFQRDTLGFLSTMAERYGDIAYYRMAAFHFYQINNPDYVQAIIVRQDDKIEKWGRQTATWANAVGHSTLTLEGEPWQRTRRIMNPAFRAMAVRRYHSVVVAHTRRLLDRWQSGQVYEMMFEMMRTTMGIIADIIFSVEDIERDAAELNRALTVVFEVLTARTTALQQLPPWLPTRDNLRLRGATRSIEGFIMGMIRRRRAEGGVYGDILGDLMAAEDEESGERLSDREICNELKTLFGAGHETTALMLMWTIHLLTGAPEVQDRLLAEARSVLGARAPAVEDLKLMPYSEQVLNEAMRIYPPAWSLMVRRAREDLQVGETVIPTGSVLLIPMWVIHRDPRIFPDPLRFDPERFAGDWRRRYPPYAYFPFGGGPHVCLGAHLAMFEGQLILPMLIQRYRFEAVPQPEPRLQALLTLRPRDGLQVRVVGRPMPEEEPG